jgi:hypothetical protein
MLSLDDILAPLGAAAFTADHLGRAPAHLAAGGPPLPDWAALAELLNMSSLWSAETFSVLRDGAPVPPDEYCETATDRDLQPAQRPRAARVLALKDAGAILIARQVETLTPPLKAITAALESGLGARVTGDLHIHGPASALAPTLALTDLLVIALAGTLDAEIDAGPLPHPVAHPRLAPVTATPARGTRLLAARLAPGHRLYVPRGCVHALAAHAPDTAYVVLALARPLGLDLLQALIDAAVEEPFFRAEVPPDGNARAVWLGELGRQLAALASGPQGAAAAAQVEQRFRRDLSAYQLNAGMVSGNTARYRRNASQLEVVAVGGGWQLRAARGAAPIPPGRERQVAWIVERTAFTRAELGAAFPDVDATTLDGLVRDLAAMKVIVTVL